MIAALFVETNGVYFGRPNVDPYDVNRDARLYAGPWRIVAHSPCQRWGRYWHGGPSARVRMVKGDDAGCFVAALNAIRKWGGILEHPEASAAWAWYGLPKPPKSGGWVRGAFHGEWTCCVEQGHYGHRARKATWLYCVSVERPPELRWGPSARKMKLDEGFHSAEERRAFMRPHAGMSPELREKRRRWLARYAEYTGKELVCAERMNKRERTATPPEFADLLISIADRCVTPWGQA